MWCKTNHSVFLMYLFSCFQITHSHYWDILCLLITQQKIIAFYLTQKIHTRKLNILINSNVIRLTHDKLMSSKLSPITSSENVIVVRRENEKFK